MSQDDDADPATDWSRVEADLRWCLVEGRGVDGRDVLFESLQMRDEDRRRAAFHNGFVMSHRDEDAVQNFVRCEREDFGRLLDLGRRIIGLPPLTSG
jgi:hypothetical protein